MKQIHCLWLLLSFSVFALAGWQSTSPTLVIVPGGSGYELRSDYTAIDPDQACASIIPFDGKAAYERHNSDDNLILWTFLVNFNQFSPFTGNPLGCLRLYHRVEPSTSRPAGTYDEIDGGGILVDTCTPGPLGSVKFDGDAAIFKEGEYVQCAMNILAWVRLLTGDDRSPGILPEEFRSDLDRFFDHHPHSYQSLAMVASLRSVESTIGADLPIIYYDAPWDGLWWTFDQSMLIRLLQTNTGPGLTFPIDRCTTSDYILTINDTPIIWWYDFERSVRKYEYQRGEEIKSCNAPSPFFSPPWFWIGPATLYIGNTPTSGSFQGSLDGVLIDPTDSRPPKRS